jgi:hypothetical protein
VLERGYPVVALNRQTLGCHGREQVVAGQRKSELTVAGDFAEG